MEEAKGKNLRRMRKKEPIARRGQNPLKRRKNQKRMGRRNECHPLIMKLIFKKEVTQNKRVAWFKKGC